jgi:hypothetical protein
MQVREEKWWVVESDKENMFIKKRPRDLKSDA